MTLRQDTISIGLGVNISSINTFDWQQEDFVVGSIKTFVFSSSSNQPAGVSYPSTTSVTCEVVQNRGILVVVRLSPLSNTDSSRTVYMITISGSKGSRTFKVTQDFNSDPTTIIPVANGGTGGNTQASARSGLGLGDSVTYNVGTSGTNIPLLSSSNTWGGIQYFDTISVGSTRTNSTVLELGSLTSAVSSNIDFHSSGVNQDFDARLSVNGGVSGTSGKADVRLTANSFSTANLALDNALPVTSGGTGGNTPALARKGLELDETATDIDFRGAKVVTRETHASGIFASKPSSGGVNGGQIKSNCTINGVEVASAYLQMLKTVNSTDTTARLTVYQKGTGGVGGSEATKNFDFASNGNFYMDGTAYFGGLVVTNIVANNSISCRGSILADAGANVGVAPHNTNSNNGIRLWAHTSDADQGQYVNTVSGGWYAGNWSLGAVRGGGTDLRSAQLNVSGGSGGGNSSYVFKPNGVADALQWNNISDRRQKKDIKTVENPIEKMKQFHGVTFTYLNGVPSAGYIAQDVQEVLPEVVTADHEGMLNMNVAGVGALHHEAILALVARVEELEKKIAELTAQ